MSNVSLKKVYKKYGKAPYAVRDFNLEIEDKEFIVLVGPSGCGKSTTLRMIAGLEDISEGEIFIEDKLVNEMEPKDRDIAMVFQNYALYPHMSVYDNMAFALKLRKFDKKTIHERVNEAAGILGIQDLLERKPKTLSGGQRQRVAIGRAIVRNPKVFLMDEPLSNLDAKLRNQMRAELIQLRKRINTTFVYVTHDQIEAMTLGDRIVIMKDAEVQQIDKPQNVYKRPANVFVAGFIGTPQMNFFENGRLIKANGRYFIEIFGNSYDLPSEKQEILAEKNQQNCDIILGIRPEDAQISSGRSSVKAVVDLYELMGNEIYLHITIDSQQAVLRTRATTQLHEADELEVQFIEEHMHIFDKNTKMNLL